MYYGIRMASVCLDKRPLRRDDLRYPALSCAPGMVAYLAVKVRYGG